MKVILTHDVKNVGKADEIVNVSEGYYRNFLAPRKLAVPAEGGALEVWQRKKKAEEAKAARTATDAKDIAKRLSEMQITVKGKVGTGTKLYGAVTHADIAEALEKQNGIKIDKRKIEIDEPIKSLGVYDVPIRLHKDALAHLKVEVVGE